MPALGCRHGPFLFCVTDYAAAVISLQTALYLYDEPLCMCRINIFKPVKSAVFPGLAVCRSYLGTDLCFVRTRALRL
jgi:hypothetical protein